MRKILLTVAIATGIMESVSLAHAHIVPRDRIGSPERIQFDQHMREINRILKGLIEKHEIKKKPQTR